MARSHRLSVYDGAYRDLAMVEGLPLVTQDEALRAAAEEADGANGVVPWPHCDRGRHSSNLTTWLVTRRLD